MSQLPERLESYLCSFVSQSTRYAFELETGTPGELLASTLLLWAKTAASDTIRCATVNAICGLVTASEGAREKISSQNGLQIVADCLHTSNTENGISACAQTLTVLARASRDRKMLCCHRFAVSDLVQASQTRSEATSRKCAACLKEIALEYSCHNLLLKCSTVEATSIFLRKRPADAAVKLLLILWHNLSCTNSSWARFGPHLDILNVYMNHSAAAMQSLTLCIVCNVLSHPGNCEHFGRQTVFKTVMDRSSPLSALGVSTKSCFVLQNALRLSYHCRKLFAEKGGVGMMIKLVLIYEENDIRESALTVALMTIQHIPTESCHVLSSITQLLEILSYDLTTFEVAIRILNLLAFLAKSDDLTRQKIVAMNAISIIVQFFIIPEKLGDPVVLKHQKDGDRILALKLATAFLSLLSRSKKVLTRLTSHGGLAMMISILAEHSISALPEEVVVNSSIFLANLSADRQGLNDIVSTCGIPVILKSAVVTATAISNSQSELQSPYRMRKFPALRGLPSSPQVSPAPSETDSKGIINSRENIEHGGNIESANTTGVADSIASSPLIPINFENGNTCSNVETVGIIGLLEEHTETDSRSVPSLPHSITMVTTSNFAPEILAAEVVLPISLESCSDSVGDKKSWLSLIGMPVASRTIKFIIKSCITRFESIDSAVECCLNNVVAQIESINANKDSALEGAECIIESQSTLIAANTSNLLVSRHSESCAEVTRDKDPCYQEQEVKKAEAGLERANTEAALRLVVEDIIRRAEEVNTQIERDRQVKDDSTAKDHTEWAEQVDAEDVWGKYNIKFDSFFCIMTHNFRYRRGQEMESHHHR
jgi:hypothetical protein